MTRTDPMPERMIRPTITDQEVALLPLADGRADLLEEIMSTPVLDHAEPATRRTPPGWLVAGAAAAAVAAIALGSTLGGDAASPDRVPSADPPPEQSLVQSPEFRAAPVAPVVPEVPDGPYVGLEVLGWDVVALYEGYGELTIGWKNGDQWLEIVRYPADSYQSYFADRDAYREGTAGSLFGQAATTWAYSRNDHATMTEPADGFYFEIRAAGLLLPAYEDLVSGLVQTDEAGFYEGLPEGTLTPENHDQTIRDLLRGVTVPDGFGVDDVRPDGFASPYHASAAVAGAVGCAWLDVYAGGTPVERKQALAAFEGSVDWPLLQAMDAQGDYPEVFWKLVDDLRGGRSAAELKPGIC